jgi:hypothetical protein
VAADGCGEQNGSADPLYFLSESVRPISGRVAKDDGPPARHIAHMNNAHKVLRLTLVPREEGKRMEGTVRRYQLARFTSSSRQTGIERYAYLKRAHD